jgi:hypothetical protein
MDLLVEQSDRLGRRQSEFPENSLGPLLVGRVDPGGYVRCLSHGGSREKCHDIVYTLLI